MLTARDERQILVRDWAERCFGKEAARGRKQRVLRLLEETLELAQVEGVTPLEIARLGFDVYQRPIGDPEQEVGGIGICLLAYCEATGLSADRAELFELRRILAKPPAHFVARDAAKAAAAVEAAAMAEARLAARDVEKAAKMEARAAADQALARRIDDTMVTTTFNGGER